MEDQDPAGPTSGPEPGAKSQEERTSGCPATPARQSAKTDPARPGQGQRRLILIGSYMERVTQTDPDRKARLMKELDSFLERDRDRELFDLPPKEVSQ